ncbi:MAG: ABC transporter permease [Acidimicrobiia bacterium]
MTAVADTPVADTPVAAQPIDDATRHAPRTLIRLPTGVQYKARHRRVRGVERFIGVAVLFAIWEIAAHVGWLSPQVLAPPSKVVSVGWDLVRDGVLGPALWASLTRVLWGFAIGVPLATLLAVTAGLTRLGDDLIDRNVQMLRFVPVIGLQSVLILWLGIGETVKITLIVVGVVFPVYVNTYSAIRQLDPGYLQLAKVVGLGRAARIRRVVLPGAMPGFLVGLRMSAAVAWLVLVFAEQINATNGLGYLIIKAQTFFQSDVIIVCLLVYAVLGLLTDTLLRALERGVLRWQPGQ